MGQVLGSTRRQASWAEALTAKLLGISVSVVKKVGKEIVQNDGTPASEEADMQQDVPNAGSTPLSPSDAWATSACHHVRAALGNAYERNGGDAYEREIARLRQVLPPDQRQIAAGAHFFQEAVYWAASLVREMDAACWNDPGSCAGVLTFFCAALEYNRFPASRAA